MSFSSKHLLSVSFVVVLSISFGHTAAAQIAGGSNRSCFGPTEFDPSKTPFSICAMDENSELPKFPYRFRYFAKTSTGIDFWRQPFESSGTLRVFAGDSWRKLREFPNTQNGCGNGIFMIRWRSINPKIHVRSGLEFGGTALEQPVVAGSKGFMIGHNCLQPAFSFAKAVATRDTLGDVVYEIEFYRPSVD